MCVLEQDILKMANFLIESLILKVNKKHPNLNYFSPLLDSILVTLGNSKGCGFENNSDAGSDNVDNDLLILDEQLF